MSKRKITKKEKENLFSTLLIAGGVWLAVSPTKELIASTFGGGVSFFIGIGLILFALWRYDVI